jgi:hypothetical protein
LSRSIEQQEGEEMVVVAEPKAKVVKGEPALLLLMRSLAIFL